MSLPRNLTKRGAALATATAAALLSVGMLSAPAAQADNSSTLTVVGTSDVYDSQLIQSVIKPGFEAANPGITLNYVSLGTGAAIAYAEAGTASALLVHAASQENQFVASGYSDNNQYGHAFFYGDYVLVGPASDPAHVATAGPHDIVKAFEAIATAGTAGHAEFVSRGGAEPPPGTATQEHKIWGDTTGVSLCTLSTANGGGSQPSTTTGTCPDTATPPSWYHTNASNQGTNLLATDTCNFGHGQDCYTLVDRGTYDYYESQHELTNLDIVSQHQSATATGAGGPNLLANSFHGYAVNPDKFTGNPNVHLNTVGAQKFLSYVTSPEGQAAVGTYLANAPGGAPFLPSAEPKVTRYRSATNVGSGSVVTIHGTVSNVVPGTPALAHRTVYLTVTPQSADLAPTTRATTTDAGGHYVFRFVPTAIASYTVRTPHYNVIEDSTLSPPFGDVLVANSVSAGSIAVTGRPSVTKASLSKSNVLTTSGGLSPKVAGNAGSLSMEIVRVGSSGPKRLLGSKFVHVGATTFDTTWQFPSGHWKWQLVYGNTGIILPGSTAQHSF